MKRSCGFPFAPGAVERFERRRTRLQCAADASLVIVLVAALSALGGVLAGYARGKGWL
jgi:hypothetical protein